MEKIYHIKSPGKSIITVSDGNITIEAKGFLNTLNKGLSGAKTIKVKNITSVQIKKTWINKRLYSIWICWR